MGKIADALLDDVVCDADGLAVFVHDILGYAEGGGVEGSLRDEAVREREAEEARDGGGDAEKENVPVKAGWLAEWELGALGDER